MKRCNGEIYRNVLTNTFLCTKCSSKYTNRKRNPCSIIIRSD